MPVVLRRGYAGTYSEALLEQRVLCRNMAVQSMSPTEIHALLMGEPHATDVSLLCCMVTDLAAEDGSPLWCAAVTANAEVCSADETLIVPLSSQWVRSALLCGISDFWSLEFPENAMLRRLIAAHRSARFLERQHSLSTLECNTPKIDCVRTMHALLAVHAPEKSIAKKRMGLFEPPDTTPRLAANAPWALLPPEIQTTIVCECLSIGGDVRTLRQVCRTFRDVVVEEIGLVKQKLISAVADVDARSVNVVGTRAASMGLRPVHMLASETMCGWRRVRA